MSTHTIDPLQGIRDERQSAWDNAAALWDTWPTVDPDDAMGVLIAWIENARACAALDLEIIRLESRQ